MEDLIAQAKMAEQCERYEDMAKYMKDAAQSNQSAVMGPETRNLLSVAYKNVVGSRRSAWRIVNSLLAKSGDSSLCKDYKKHIEDELKGICREVLDLLEKLIDSSEEPEVKVFFWKMKGDYHRYLSEVDSSEDVKKDSEEAYKSATEIAAKNMEAWNPIRLGLALNFSVFYYEIMNKPKKAIEMANKAFEEAINVLEQQPKEDNYKDSTLIMQLLRDNLTLWKSEEEEGEGAPAEGKEEES